MGNFMIPVCCICGEAAKSFDDSDWAFQDFCPAHEYLLKKLNNEQGVQVSDTTGDEESGEAGNTKKIQENE